MKQFILLLLLCTIGLSSCVTNKKINYLQSSEEPSDTTSYVQTSAPQYLLRPGDELYINIQALYEQGGRAFNGAGETSQRVTSQTAYYESYPIYEDGTIDYPYLGKIKVAGLTMEEVRTQFKTELSEYTQGMSVIIKLATNYISILGEVKSPGRKQLTAEKLDIFGALALAGDLNSYGKRAEIKIIRETKEGRVIKTFDINREDIINSEFYWVLPGDIIYVSRIEGQFFKLDSFSDIMVIFSTSLSLVLLALSF